VLVVTIASDAELLALRKKVALKDQTVCAGSLYMKALLNGREILLVKTGIGPKKALSAAKYITRHFSPSRVLSIGAAGATDPSLQVGDIVLVDSVLREAGAHNHAGSSFQTDVALRKEAAAALGERGVTVHTGTCLTLDRFIHSKTEKRRIFSRHNVAVVDMESAALARQISSAEIPFFDIRIVSDAAVRDTLDVYGMFMAQKRAGIAGRYLYFMKRPGELVRAVRFRKDLARVSSIIAQVTEVVVGALV